jgi:hypothetical protein
MYRFASLAALVALAGTAHATTLCSPILPGAADKLAQCAVTNVGTKPITVTISAIDLNGVDVTANTECQPTLDPGKSCQTYATVGSSAYCRFVTSSSKVRATLNVFGPNGFIDSIPATK